MLIDNAKAMVPTHTCETLVIHPTYADFCCDDGIRSMACQPERP
jgi:hypothetical protein